MGNLIRGLLRFRVVRRVACSVALLFGKRRYAVMIGLVGVFHRVRKLLHA